MTDTGIAEWFSRDTGAPYLLGHAAGSTGPSVEIEIDLRSFTTGIVLAGVDGSADFSVTSCGIFYQDLDYSVIPHWLDTQIDAPSIDHFGRALHWRGRMPLNPGNRVLIGISANATANLSVVAWGFVSPNRGNATPSW